MANFAAAVRQEDVRNDEEPRADFHDSGRKEITCSDADGVRVGLVNGELRHRTLAILSVKCVTGRVVKHEKPEYGTSFR